jgi:hypothetical protein
MFGADEAMVGELEIVVNLTDGVMTGQQAFCSVALSQMVLKRSCAHRVSLLCRA